jgi:hypothetical protein
MPQKKTHNIELENVCFMVIEFEFLFPLFEKIKENFEKKKFVLTCFYISIENIFLLFDLKTSYKNCIFPI